MRKLLIAVGALVLPAVATGVTATGVSAAADGPVTWKRPVAVSVLPNGTPAGAYFSWFANGSVSGGGSGRIVVWSDGGQVFVRDRKYGRTTRVAAAPAWGSANERSWDGSISEDGRYVAFGSVASNLVPGDTNGAEDVFVRDLWTFTTRRVSVTAAGVQGNGPSRWPVISGDGRYVTYFTQATNLVPGLTAGTSAVAVTRLADGRVTRVSNPTGAGVLTWPTAVSRDAHYVTYVAAVAPSYPTINSMTVLVKDRWSGQTWDTRAGSGLSPWWSADMSGDGRFVVQFMPGGPAGGQVYVFDRTTNSLTLVSRRADGSTPRASTGWSTAISDDGRWVAFTSQDTLLAGRPSGLFVRDRGTGALTLAVPRAAGITWPNAGSAISISGDGKTVFYEGTNRLLYAVARAG